MGGCKRIKTPKLMYAYISNRPNNRTIGSGVPNFGPVGVFDPFNRRKSCIPVAFSVGAILVSDRFYGLGKAACTAMYTSLLTKDIDKNGLATRPAE